MKRFLLFLLVPLLSACSTIRVSYDYERGQDWTAYGTYNYYPEMQTGMSELDSRRLTAALEEVLRQRGYRQSEEPDFLINIYSETFQGPSGSSIGVGMGGTGRNVGGGVSVGIPVNGSSLQRQITFDIIDNAQQILIWQAVSTDRYREGAAPIEREQHLHKLAEKVFSGFPPRK